jgi:hypothetical protein
MIRSFLQFLTAYVIVFFQTYGHSLESQRKLEEVFFGKFEYSHKLEKSGEYSHSLNSRASGHMLVFSNCLGWIDLEKLRVPGVLQRFAITYFIVASTAFLFSKQADNGKEEKVSFGFCLNCLFSSNISSIMPRKCFIYFAVNNIKPYNTTK